jgi:hypothetical protein
MRPFVPSDVVVKEDILFVNKTRAYKGVIFSANLLTSV